MTKVPFSADSTIGAWRDQTLNRNSSSDNANEDRSGSDQGAKIDDRWKARIPDAGEDFFFVQEVRSLLTVLIQDSNDLPFDNKMREASVGE
jgi:hypothetical protein